MVDDLVSRYRPPELLLGERHYGPPVDMWGAGCVMAEMWTRSPIMQVDLGAETSTGSEFLSFLRISEFFRFI